MNARETMFASTITPLAEYTRLNILFGPDAMLHAYNCGIMRFEKMSAEMFRQLKVGGFFDEDMTPMGQSLTRYCKIMRRWGDRGLLCHGYLIDPVRRDCRITIKGISYAGPHLPDLWDDFKRFSQTANRRVCEQNQLKCWWEVDI